jgi:XTP/dITP diphosphohydrolase
VLLYCATTNRGKLREFRLAAAGVCELESLPGIEQIEPPEETGSTFRENAVLKAAYYGAHTPGLLFAEDSGLVVPALEGAP